MIATLAISSEAPGSLRLIPNAFIFSPLPSSRKGGATEATGSDSSRGSPEFRTRVRMSGHADDLRGALWSHAC